jgi:hypothetical protein
MRSPLDQYAIVRSLGSAHGLTCQDPPAPGIPFMEAGGMVRGGELIVVQKGDILDNFFDSSRK